MAKILQDPKKNKNREKERKDENLIDS